MAAGKAFPFAYEQQDLSNGLRVVLVPLPWRGVASVYIIVGAGSRNEVEPGRSGFAHFFEHMMFRGTPRFPPERYEAELQRLGAASNAYTDDDRTVYHTTLACEDLEQLLEMEADRFLNLRYSEEDFRTEALAVLGEYMKDSADPLHRLEEVLRDTAFDVHPYKHTTMGFLHDIERMPGMYDYSLQFFDRFYRPENTTLLVAGDIRTNEVLQMIARHWGAWQRGSYRLEPPKEPPQAGLREARIEWAAPTLPYVAVAQRAPAYCDSSPDCAALDLISLAGFSEGSDLYRCLVIDSQWVEDLWANRVDHIDPYLFIVTARVKQPGRLAEVRRAIEEELARFAVEPLAEERLEAVKSHLRYSFVLSMDRSEAVAAALAPYIGLRRTPETVDRIFARYAEAAPADLERVAKWCFTPQSRTVVTLEEKRR
jgi:zinc protease